MLIYIHEHTYTRICSRMKIFDILPEFATFALYARLQDLVILHLLTNINHFRKRLLKFSGCFECCHSPSIFVSIHMPLVTLVRHSEAFATFVRHLQGVCSVRRFPFLVNICQRHIHSVFIQTAASSSNIPIVREWQGSGNVGKTFASFISTFVTFASPFVSIRKHS